MDKEVRVIISGGGTGGHIFPAISIANAIKIKCPDAKILFVGALGRMEMQRVPAAGYEIKGLPICGFDRRNLFRNVVVLYKIWKSQRLATKIIKAFRPTVAVGVGGYASGPTLNKCAAMGIPCLIQEQNSYAGVTNKLLAKKAAKICVAYEGMQRFFPKDKIVMTGNPVRQSLLETTVTREEAVRSFGLDPSRRVILLVGGSLGARTLNESVLTQLDLIAKSGIQIIWQTGKYYQADIAERLKRHAPMPMLCNRLYFGYGGSLSRRRFGNQSGRRRQHFGVLFAWKTCNIGAESECGRGPSDQECDGFSQSRSRSLRVGCRCAATSLAVGRRDRDQ